MFCFAISINLLNAIKVFESNKKKGNSSSVSLISSRKKSGRKRKHKKFGWRTVDEKEAMQDLENIVKNNNTENI